MALPIRPVHHLQEVRLFPTLPQTTMTFVPSYYASFFGFAGYPVGAMV